MREANQCVRKQVPSSAKYVGGGLRAEVDWLSTTADQGARDYWEAKTQDLLPFQGLRDCLTAAI